jgi:hypothetical protein
MAHGEKKRNVNNILVEKPRAKSRDARPVAIQRKILKQILQRM